MPDAHQPDCILSGEGERRRTPLLASLFLALAGLALFLVWTAIDGACDNLNALTDCLRHWMEHPR